jgi:hypothetical protein
VVSMGVPADVVYAPGGVPFWNARFALVHPSAINLWTGDAHSG